MTPVVKVTCPQCRTNANVSVDAVRVVVCDHGATYVWPCGTCAAYVSKPAPAPVRALLLAAGVLVLTVAHEGGFGPPITEDDLIAFGLELEATP